MSGMTESPLPTTRPESPDAGAPRGPRRAVCVGSFDPVHLGHVGIIERAAALFDEVIVAVADNPSKQHRFPIERRVQLVEDSLRDSPGRAEQRVSVEPLGGGLLAQYVQRRGAVAVVKGLRSGQDFDYELPMEAMNRSQTGMETVFLAAAPELAHVSSSLVKEVHGFGGDVAAFVPAPVLAALDETRER
ncbi:pantetheine-phosphate adenylyltransferase [Kocuria palustris]|uniref:pantetheine-phosphate adenylyltransferase n=1 Tax=Kocuria palustris TaxID=71999 RepID=UPI0021B3AEDE|nr:pantetheine-phosphate adenylyltransferase [Kocuria palustris]